jgi:glyoxylase-like metal-dependent hydrolase (beta-lactamase superfamily II)
MNSSPNFTLPWPRSLTMTSHRFGTVASVLLALFCSPTPVCAEVNKAQEVAPGVWFHEGDIGRKGHCNNGWIVFKDFILVVDGNFPSGALEVLPKIKASSPNPIRFTFDTHHHGDHAYGNQIWFENGATIVAHQGVLDEMRKYEPALFGGNTGRWQDEAKKREDIAKSSLRAPSILFPKQMVFEDSTHRVELQWFGVAHTHGDGFAWLPNERILFTGDACVNGPYNYMGDGNALEWIPTLEAARALNPKTVCPGHGLMGGVEILDNQIAFLKALRGEVQRLRDAGKSPAQAKDSIDAVKATLQKQEAIANYIGGMFASQVEKFWVDLGGKPFETAGATPARRPKSDSEVIAKLP